MRQALAVLDATVRTTLELSYFEGLTADEIAEHMQVPVGTVKSRLARGLSQLEAILNDLDEAETTHDGVTKASTRPSAAPRHGHC